MLGINVVVSHKTINPWMLRLLRLLRLLWLFRFFFLFRLLGLLFRLFWLFFWLLLRLFGLRLRLWLRNNHFFSNTLSSFNTKFIARHYNASRTIIVRNTTWTIYRTRLTIPSSCIIILIWIAHITCIPNHLKATLTTCTFKITHICITLLTTRNNRRTKDTSSIQYFKIWSPIAYLTNSSN